MVTAWREEVSVQEFIQQVMATLGTSEHTTQTATGALLGYLDSNASGDEAKRLIDAIPGARDLMASSQPPGVGALGGLGGVASALGFKSGGTAALLAALQGSGLSAETAPKFVAMFIQFAKSKAGADLVAHALSAVPGLPH